MAKKDTPVITDNSTPVDPNESYLPTSFIFAPEARSMGGEIDEQPVTVESDNI